MGIEATENIDCLSSTNLVDLSTAFGISPETEELAPVAEELCVSHGELLDIRNLRIAILMSTEEDAFESFLSHTFSLYSPELGDTTITAESLSNLCEVFLFLSSKEANELVQDVVKEDL